MARDGKMGGYLGAPNNGYAGRLEVIGGPTGRKRRSDEAKARIALEGLMPGASVSEVARRHAVTRWQVYDWRSRLRDGRLVVPDDVTAPPTFAALAVEDPKPPKLEADSGAIIEVVVSDVVIRAAANTEVGHLSQVIRAARAAVA